MEMTAEKCQKASETILIRAPLSKNMGPIRFDFICSIRHFYPVETWILRKRELLKPSKM